jgi:hypothetical protein
MTPVLYQIVYAGKSDIAMDGAEAKVQLCSCA